MNDLFEQLNEYRKSNQYPMHMPGHKRNSELVSCPEPYGIDITEIDGFDNLHHATGILKECMKTAATCFHADRTFFLVNGSSSGILIAIFAATKPGDTVLIARNSHRAVYHALELRGLKPVYLMPELFSETGICRGITAAMVEQSITEHPEAALVVITSPTYEGVLSDVRGISEAAHHYGIPVFVDEAHGAHLGFHLDFFENSNSCGADLVVQSTHKTLPAMTQTALLHCNGTRVDEKKVEEYSAMFQTSSPSYLLMGSIDHCVRLLLEEGETLFEIYSKRLRAFYQKASQLQVLRVMEADFGQTAKERRKDARDASKIVIVTENIPMTGPQLYDILRRDYAIQPEMAAGNYVLCMTSIADTEEGFERLLRALLKIDQQLLTNEKAIHTKNDLQKHKDKTNPEAFFLHIPDYKMSVEQAKAAPQERCLPEDAEGKAAGEYLFLYPPGIPLLVPGEIIGKPEIQAIQTYKEQGLTVYGLDEDGKAAVVK